MTLPASGAISMSQIANEVGLALPISINHAWLLALIGKTGFPISFSNFYGKTGRFDGGVTLNGNKVGGFGSPPFFGGTLNSLNGIGGAASINTLSTPASIDSINLLLKNNTTGISGVLSPTGISGSWTNNSPPANLLRANTTDSFTVTLST